MKNLRTLRIPDVENFAVISDVHLQNPEDPRTHCFLSSLEELKEAFLSQKKIKTLDGNISPPQVLFLLGDIFDFIKVPKRYFLHRWKKVFQKFTALRQAGMAIYFIEGNHDFGFEYFPSPELDQALTARGDMEIVFCHPSLGRLVLRHGDDIVCPLSYYPFRRIVKSATFQRIASFIPGCIMAALANKFAKLSRKKESYKLLTMDMLDNCIHRYLKTEKERQGHAPDVLIIGHIHMEVDRSTCETRVIASYDWLRSPSILFCAHDGTFQRARYGNERKSDNNSSAEKEEHVNPSA